MAEEETKQARAPETQSDAIDRVSPDLKAKFTQVGQRYHFKDGALAFTDRGNRITSPSENTEVIKSVIAIAKERGWSGDIAGWRRKCSQCSQSCSRSVPS